MTKLRKLRKLLVQSFEEPLGNQDQQLLNAGLEASKELQKDKQEILKLRGNLKAVEADFSQGFEQKVMNALREKKVQAGTFEILPIFRTVAFSGIAAILIVLFGVYFADGSLTFDSIMGIGRYAPDLGLLAFF